MLRAREGLASFLSAREAGGKGCVGLVGAKRRLTRSWERWVLILRHSPLPAPARFRLRLNQACATPSPPLTWGRGIFHHNVFASASSASILAGFLRPGRSSTPEETSMRRAPESATASARLSGLRPPASIQGLGQSWPCSSRQSKEMALPPGNASFIEGGGLASNSNR